MIFASGNGEVIFPFGTYDAVGKKITDTYNHTVVYSNKTDGKLYKVSAVKGSVAPTPVQLSNEVLCAGTLCSDGLDDGDAGMDLANANNSQYLYQLKGVDGLCGTVDDVYKMVRLGMTASDTPITAKKPVMEINDWSTTGVLTHWLVHDGGNLQCCDASFANCSVITTATTIIMTRAWPPSTSATTDRST